MPFDGVGLGFDDRMYKIDRVFDLLAAPDRWCKGTLWTHDGRHCIRAAIMAVDGLGTLRPVVLRAINEVTGHHYWSIEKNQRPSKYGSRPGRRGADARPHGPGRGTSGHNSRQSARAGQVGSSSGPLGQQVLSG